jgi:hypothetical protein
VKITLHRLLSGKYGNQKNIAVTNFHTLLQRQVMTALFIPKVHHGNLLRYTDRADAMSRLQRFLAQRWSSTALMIN